MIDTVNGAKSSAIIYSIVETAKANNLNPSRYFELLLTEIPRHMEDTDRTFLKKLEPWSQDLLYIPTEKTSLHGRLAHP